MPATVDSVRPDFIDLDLEYVKRMLYNLPKNYHSGKSSLFCRVYDKQLFLVGFTLRSKTGMTLNYFDLCQEKLVEEKLLSKRDLT